MPVSRRGVILGAPALLGIAAAADAWTVTRERCAALVRDQRSPGLSVAVRRRGRTVFDQSFGLADVGRGRALRPDTPLRVASVAKPLMAVLVLRLRREGKLGLDDSLARWIPEFPRARELTVRMLLTHTSGLGEYTRTPLDQLTRDAARDYTPEQIVERMARTRPLFVGEPGKSWRYSNTGYVLLGVAAERAGGAPVAELLRDRVAAPAGLSRTAWDHPAAPETAVGHLWRARRWEPIPYVSGSYVGASGAVRSTAADLCGFAEAMFDGRLLTPSEVAEVLAPALPGRGPSYGLGVFTGRAFGMRVVHHSGSTAGFAADWRVYPEEGLSIAMLANADPSRMGAAPRDIRRAALEAALGRPMRT